MCRRVGPFRLCMCTRGKFWGIEYDACMRHVERVERRTRPRRNFQLVIHGLFFYEYLLVVLFCHTLTHLNVGRAAPPQPLIRARASPRAAGRRARRRAGAPLSTISLTSHCLKAATHSLLHCAGRRAAAGELPGLLVQPEARAVSTAVPSSCPARAAGAWGEGTLSELVGAHSRLATALPPPCQI